METTYFIIVNGNQAGPFVREELKYHGLTHETMVWRQGLENWVPASTLPELNDLLGICPPPHSEYYGVNSQPQSHTPGAMHADPFTQPYAQPQPRMQPTAESGSIPHTNWMPWAIVCTVLGCLTSCITLILGIIGIVQANKANDMYNRGNRVLGDSANSSAKTVTICGLVLGVISIIGFVIMLCTGYLDHILAIAEALD